MLIDEMNMMFGNSEKKEPENPRIAELEHRLTLLTLAHEELRRRVDSLEKKNKPIERIW